MKGGRREDFENALCGTRDHYLPGLHLGQSRRCLRAGPVPFRSRPTVVLRSTHKSVSSNSTLTLFSLYTGPTDYNQSPATVHSVFFSSTLAMNWTGGRLRRHSNNSRSATVSKIQKQNFAKSRAKASRGNHHDLPFQGFSQFRQSHENGPHNQADKETGEAIHVSIHRVKTPCLR